MRTVLMRVGLICCTVAAIAACNDSTGPEGQVTLSLNFVAATAPVSTAVTASTSTGMTLPLARAVSAEGSNGTLTLDAIQIVVDEFELERVDGACEDAEEGADDDEDECEEVELDPYFLDLELDGVPVNIATAQIESGTYSELELETKDLVSDDDDDGDEVEISVLADEVRDAYPDWPDQASLRVVGSFDPGDGSDVRSFVVYLEAEVEIELEFDPPAVVDAEDPQTAILVEIDPRAWFTRSDGTVWDLSAWDYAATGAVVEFEAEMEHGFTRVEIDDD